jgi:hypothetical protein
VGGEIRRHAETRIPNGVAERGSVSSTIDARTESLAVAGGRDRRISEEA